MQPEQDRPTVSIAPNNPVFDLPVIVGIERGLFAKAGLDVSFSATYADREKDSVQTPLMSRLKENLFDCGSADTYNVCEWASIDRLERGKGGGRGTGDPQLRRQTAGPARPVGRAGHGAGVHRLVLHDDPDARKRRRFRA